MSLKDVLKFAADEKAGYVIPIRWSSACITTSESRADRTGKGSH